MLNRFVAATVLSFALSTSAITTVYASKPGDEALATAAAHLKAKDYQGAHAAAGKSSADNGPKALLLGYSAAKLELWDEAAQQMANAAQSYPLLADYALYYQGLALSKLKKNDEALVPLYKLLKDYRDSRLVRSAWILYADTLYAGGYNKEALASYASFIERYPAGNDSLQAVLGSARCRANLGELPEAVKILRETWINYPAAPIADTAAQELQGLAGRGAAVSPYSTAELMKRAATLFDVGRFARAAETLSQTPLEGENAETICKVRLKRGQALSRAKRYADAEELLKVAVQSGITGCSTEANLWLGRTLDSAGRGDEAYALFLKLANAPELGPLSDEALLKAAYLKRFQRKPKEALPLFQKYLARHPEQKPNGTVLWETAWAAYQSASYPEAGRLLKRLAERDDFRERALYWLGKSLIASGDPKGGATQLAQLCAEYPFGYYAWLCNNGTLVAEPAHPPVNLRENLPYPAGFEREKALIALGLYDEAARELQARKTKNTLAVVRLYLEMENYNGAYHAATKGKKIDRDSATALGIRYPLAFREPVVKNAAANGLPESLVYAIMYAESTFAPGAVSPVGAVGLMQIMPATADRISHGDSARLTRPELNIRLGTKHLKDLLKSNDGNLPLAVASYNAGSGNVKRWQRNFGDLPQDEFVENIPFGETRDYVKKVIGTMAFYQKLYNLPNPYARKGAAK
ncbi:lytic transglycosylase domain-containing protein [Geomesophilobacter sediminis]|uniref:Transglycosylase SLT domain-containing protein n=1 Tax=Geomesophilobacter sediminis TaxID=2798584 RepID=A0A8J7JKQ8_9BACT|nr:transglycosylase SLT domain-containing protein [Geomesophilobacter sediminis]MBJ6724100.1 transglycosylase SLT domain-containing protein [Geomesophilobacter sediminis]